MKIVCKSKSQEVLHRLIQRRKQLLLLKNQELNKLENETDKIIVKSYKSPL